ncbi:MAG TPA: metal ABC transporter ATP-binding protein [Candidatus Andersenbacteria bacterium]|nr:metal ABC transporter ATP-binding protein [Candidatus Andersenbacteria bacterium]
MDAVPALAVKNVTVELGGHTIIENISFTADVGSTTAIIGPNGAGKSILLKSILRLVPKKSGTVQIFGHDHAHVRAVAPLISYVPQVVDFDSNFPLTVQGLFALRSPRLFGLSATETDRMVSLLRLVGAHHLIHQRLSLLSGGQLQRVLLAHSLMDHPQLLLLDEPAAGIDFQGQETIYPLLHRIKAEERLTLVIISHELQIVMQYADQVLCLNKEIVCAGIPHQVLTNETLQRMYGSPMGHFTEHRHG